MKFRIGFRSTLFTVMGLAILISLGTWQAKRYISKIAFEEARDARIDLPLAALQSPDELGAGDLDFRRIQVQGHWDRERLFLISHRVYRDDPGFWIVSPLLLSSDEEPRALLVNRGWIPFSQGRERAEELLEAVPDDVVTVTGLVHVLEYVVEDKAARQRLEADPLLGQGVVPMETYDVVAMNLASPAQGFERPIVLTMGDEDGRVTYPAASYDHIVEPYLTSETHFGYALTWYLLALALIAIWIAHGMGALNSPAYAGERGDRS